MIYRNPYHISLVARGVRIAVPLLILASCGETTTSGQAPLQTVSSDDPALTNEDPKPATVVTEPGATAVDDPLPAGYPKFEYGATLVGPPIPEPEWPLEVPSGGVMRAADSGFEYDEGEPIDLLRHATGLALLTVVGVDEPEAVAGTPEMENDAGALKALEPLVGVPISVRVEDVVAGTSLTVGETYFFKVSGWMVDGVFLEFVENRVPRVGDRFYAFNHFNAIERAPQPDSQIFLLGGQSGRIPDDPGGHAIIADLSDSLDELGSELGDEFASDLRSVGLLPATGQ